MEYLLKPSAIIFIFYACYKLFLQRDTFFETNRWFLLAGIFISSGISLIVIPNYIEYTPVDYNTFTISSTTTAADNFTVTEPTMDYIQLLYWLYWSGVIFFTGRLTIQLLSLRRIIKSANKIKSGSFKLLTTHNDITPFSFFHFIVYNPKHFSSSEIEHVINHEKAHSQQWHSLDNILIHFCCILLWFNPFVWLYKRALQQNLEFIADRKAQYISPCNKSYQTVLLKASVQHHELAITNNFYTSLIKKRIVMLQKSKSKKWNQIKLLLVLPLLALFVMSFNTKDVYIKVSEDTIFNQFEQKNSESIEIIITKSTTDENLEAIKKDLNAKGITFTYTNLKRNEKGEITAINVEFKNEDNTTNYKVKGEDGIKAIRFESSDENFGISTVKQRASNVSFYSNNNKTKSQSNSSGKVIVIEEREDNDTETEDVKTIKGNSFNWNTDDDVEIIIEESDEPLFIINGKTVSKAKFEDVDSEDIESVFVLKGDSAVKKYGKDGKNGVIVMHKKGGNSFYFNTNDDMHFETETRFNVEGDDGSNPLIIVDGKVIEKKDLKDVSPNYIHEVEVIKDSEAVKAYGIKAKDGVIKITTKKDKKAKTMLSGDAVIFESEEKGPWKIDSAVSSVYYINDDNKRVESIEFVITKQSSDTFLEQQKNNLKRHGIDAKFSKIRRNKSGEITSIKISLDDNNGRKSSASWKEKNDAIPDIVMGKSNDDKLYIQAIGN